MSRYTLTDLLAPCSPPRFGEQSATGRDFFDYAAGAPNIYMLMNLKQLLVAEHGLERGFDFYRQTIPRHTDAKLDQRRLKSHHTYAKAHGLDFFEIHPAGEPFTILPPRVIGEGDHRALNGETRSFYVACLQNARVRGRSAITEVAELALADFQGFELQRIDDELEFDSAVFHRDGERIWTIAEDRAVRKVDAAFSLLGSRTDFFGDWVAESLPKYVGASLSGHLPPVPVLVDAHIPPTLRQSLDMMLDPGVEVIEVAAFETVEVKRLWSASSIAYMPFHQVFNERFKWDHLMGSPERSAPVGIEMHRRAERALGATRGPSRVFLARKAFRHRRIVNDTEIEAIAAAHGFAVVYTEEYDFAEQVRLLRDARFVVGPEGSSFFLAAFVDRGTRICVLNHTYTEGVVAYNAGAEASDIEVTILTGPKVGPQGGSPQDADYWIDPAIFRSFLETWLASATHPAPKPGIGHGALEVTLES